MSYIEEQRQKVLMLRDEVFDDPGGGFFMGKNRGFVLSNHLLNLYPSIVDRAIRYFDEYNIAWWGEDKTRPTGHLLSSQIACTNHLFPVRENKEMATKLLQKVNPDIIEAGKIENGFVGFEVIGEKNYLGEKSHLRGQYATSIDAVMVGRKANGKSVLVLIEWKYTESYRTGDNKYIPARANIYDPLIKDKYAPIVIENPAALYFEPFYQLMRQTLLGWKMIGSKEFNSDEYVHIHVIPNENTELFGRNTSNFLEGQTMSEAWKKVLVNPSLYQVVSPEELFSPVIDISENNPWIRYLQKRYWK